MTVFWISLAVLALIAAGFIVFPAWKARKHSQQLARMARNERDEQNVQIFRQRLQELEDERDSGLVDAEQFERLKLELEKILLADVADSAAAEQQASGGRAGWLMVLVLAIVTPLGGVALYLEEGASQQLAQRLELDERVAEARQLSMDELVARLEQRMQEDPSNIEGWYLLGRTYMSIGRFQEAADTFQRLMQLQGEQATLHAQYAQALYFARQGMQPEVSQSIERALALDPNEPTALGLLGIDAFENARYQQAIDYWQRVLASVEEGQNAEAIRRGIAEAHRRLGQQPQQPQQPQQQQQSQQAAARIQVQVALSAAAQQAVSPDDTVFVFARRPSGPPMPLAAQRLRVKDLPQLVTLDDASSPMGRLSDAQQVMLVARVSRGGTPQAQSGDWQGKSGPVAVSGSEPVSLLIDTRLP